MDVIPIPGSAVPCERVFSLAKETMSPHRNHIKPKLMEALQLLKFANKHNQGSLSFTSGESWSEEVARLEILVNKLGTVAEDTVEYQERLRENPQSKSPKWRTPRGRKGASP